MSTRHNAWAGSAGASHGELSAYGTLSCLGIVVTVSKPDNIGDPVLMTISRQKDIVVDIIVIKVLKSTVAIGNVSLLLLVTLPKSLDPTYTPVICGQVVDTFINRLDSGNDDLVADKTPFCTALG